MNWASLPAGGTAAGLTKPPLGRDPKSRARSRDYLKQFVQVTRTCLHTNLNTYQMSARNILPHIPRSYEPTA